MNKPQIDFEKQGGLVPAIVQDARTRTVLMLGYMNAEALDATLKTGLVTFWSRSKNRLWQKGEESGNSLKLVSITEDCDNDTLLILVEPNGPTCHTGSTSCFGDTALPGDSGNVIADLQKLIEQRKQTMPEGSYTTELFQSGLDRITQKVGEEAVEVVIAAKNSKDDEFTSEVADLLYHLLVLLTEKGLSIDEVQAVLAKRSKS